MSTFTRRHFLQSAATVAAATTIPAAFAAKRSATDLVTLGNSGVKVSRLAFGTGTFGGRVQRELGQEGFTRLVRYAYDKGIRFFETADAYTGMPVMLGEALKGLPRDSYKLMTKYRLRDTENPQATIDRFRKELQTEYLDILLLHCVRTADWATANEKLRDALSEAKQKKITVSKGASVHGLVPLRTFPGNAWLDVALMRVNHDGTKMDSLRGNDSDTGEPTEVFQHVAAVHKQGVGVLGMKLIGEGQFTTPERREAAIQHVIKQGTVDAMTIGFKSPAEIDEAMERIDRNLNA